MSTVDLAFEQVKSLVEQSVSKDASIELLLQFAERAAASASEAHRRLKMTDKPFDSHDRELRRELRGAGRDDLERRCYEAERKLRRVEEHRDQLLEAIKTHDVEKQDALSRLDERTKLLRDIQKDLVSRAHMDSTGKKMVMLSASLWNRLDDVARPDTAGEGPDPLVCDHDWWGLNEDQVKCIKCLAVEWRGVALRDNRREDPAP